MRTIYELAEELWSHLQLGSLQPVELVLARNGRAATLLRSILEHPCSQLGPGSAVALDFVRDLPAPSSEVRLSREGATYRDGRKLEAVSGNPLGGLELIASRQFEDREAMVSAPTEPPPAPSESSEPDEQPLPSQLLSWREISIRARPMAELATDWSISNAEFAAEFMRRRSAGAEYLSELPPLQSLDADEKLTFMRTSWRNGYKP